MNVTAPSKPVANLAAPINIEESRAQRLQRQQARFRDRGGIFVPSNRSTLLDILLGRTSPLKKPRRSVSVYSESDDAACSTSKAVVASKGKNRASASVAQDSDPQPRRKPFKSESGTTDIDPSLHKNSNLSGEAPLITSKKRRRNPKVQSEVEDSVDKSTKRKKHSSPSESRQSPEITVEEDNVKPVAKRSRKVAKSTRRGKKQSSTTTSKRKENAPMSKPSKKVPSNGGPPKSVLQRIKNSLGAQVIDNEPDPIDFLS